MNKENFNTDSNVKNGRLTIKKSDVILYLYLGLITFYYTLNSTVIMPKNFSRILIIALFLGCIQIIKFIKLNLKVLIPILSIVIYIIYTYMHLHDTRIIVIFVSFLCVIPCNIEQIINVLFYLKLISLFLVILIGRTGHINQFALHAGIVILLYICKNEKKIIQFYIKCIVILCSVVLLYLYTKSGSAIICLSICYFIFIFKRKKRMMNFLTCKFILLIFPTMSFLNYFFALCLGLNRIPIIGLFLSSAINRSFMNIVNFVDQITSSRLTLALYSIRKFGSSWFGGNVDYNILKLQGVEYFNLDSGYMWLLQGGGYIMTVLLMICLVLIMKYLIKYKAYNYIIAGIGIALWAFNEDMLISVGTNFLWLFVGKALIDLLKKGTGEHYGNT